MYDILGKFNNLEPKLTQVTDKDINQSVQETVDPTSLKGQIQQLEEKYMGFKKTVAAVKKGGSAEDPEAVAASIGRKKYGKEKFQKAAAAGKKLKEGTDPEYDRLLQNYKSGKYDPLEGFSKSQLERIKNADSNELNLMAHEIAGQDYRNAPMEYDILKIAQAELRHRERKQAMGIEEASKREFPDDGYEEYRKQRIKTLIDQGVPPEEARKMQDISNKTGKWLKKPRVYDPATGKRVTEAAKPDFLDLDKDGNKKESMKKAAKDAKRGVNKVKESYYNRDEHAGYSEPNVLLSPEDKKNLARLSDADQMTLGKVYDGLLGSPAVQHYVHELWNNIQDDMGAADGGDDMVFDELISALNKFKTAQIGEGKMKDLSMDLKELSEAEFKKKYGKTKAEMRKSLSEAREMKDKDEFDNRAKVGDYYVTKTGNKVTKTKTGIKHERGYKKEKDEDKDDLNEYFHYDAPKGKDRGPRDRGHDELERRAGLGKNPLVKHGKEYKAMKQDPKGSTAKAHAIAGPKGKLPESTVTEKAKSTAQQKFMGMVYAAKKGEKPASAAVAKAAKGMSKSDAKDFAKTKHKGLPQHVKESVEMNESYDIRKHPIYTTQEAWDHYAKELAEQEMSQMEADMTMEQPLMDADSELDEIARLAGLAPLPKEINIDKDTMAGKGLQKPDHMVKLPPAPPEEKYNPVLEGDACNMTAEGTMCPQHGLSECGMYSEGNEFSGALASARATGADKFEVGGKEYPVHEAEEAMDEGNEFTKARLDAIKAGKDTFTVGGKTHRVTGDTSTEKQQVEESLSVNINATDDDVVALMQKLAGLPTVAVAASSDSGCGCDSLEEERDIQWDNTPEEQTLAVSAAIPNGTDLHKSKVQDPRTANKAANPLAETEEKLWKSYERMLKAIKD